MYIDEEEIYRLESKKDETDEELLSGVDLNFRYNCCFMADFMEAE